MERQWRSGRCDFKGFQGRAEDRPRTAGTGSHGALAWWRNGGVGDLTRNEADCARRGFREVEAAAPVGVLHDGTAEAARDSCRVAKLAVEEAARGIEPQRKLIEWTRKSDRGGLRREIKVERSQRGRGG